MSIKKILKVLVFLVLPIVVVLGLYFYFQNKDTNTTTVTLTYTSSLGGTLLGQTEQVIEAGSNGTKLTAMPNSGYKFVNWSDGSTDNPRTDTQVTQDSYVIANFESTTVTLTYNSGLNGTIEGKKIQTVAYGEDSEAVTAVPNENYAFVRWSDGVTDNPRKDTNNERGLEISALFVTVEALEELEQPALPTQSTQGQYTLKYSNGGKADKGFIDGPSTQYIAPGSDGQQVRALGTSAYEFVSWSDGSTENPRKDTNINHNIDVVAIFKSKSYELTYKSNDNGGILGNTKQQIKHGNDGTEVTAVADNGYAFYKWSDGSLKNPRQDDGIKSDSTYTADFKAQGPFTLTYSASSNGSLSGTSPQTVALGGSGTAVTAIPDTGYSFSQWSDSSTSNPRTDTNVSSNVAVAAQFAINTYTLTYTSGTGGSISGTSSQIVNYGADGSAVTAVPDTGYSFSEWADGSTDNPRTDTSVMANLSVGATFAINTYTLTYTAGANGTISGTSPQTINYGSDGDAVSAIANPNYSFVDWSDGSTDNPRTDTSIMTNLAVGATFAVNDYSFSLIDSEPLTTDTARRGRIIALNSTDFVVAYDDAGTTTTLKTFRIDGSYNITEMDSSTVPAIYPALTKIDSTHFMLRYMGTTNNSIATYSVDGSLNTSPVDTFDYDTSQLTVTPAILQVDATHYILAGVSSATAAEVTTFALDGSYNISELDTLVLASNNARYFSLGLLDSTHFAVAWDDSQSTWTLNTLGLDGSYNISNINSMTRPGTATSTSESSLEIIDSTHFMLSYSAINSGNEAILETYSIDGSYILTNIDSLVTSSTQISRNSLKILDTARFVLANKSQASSFTHSLHGIFTDTSYNISEPDTTVVGSGGGIPSTVFAAIEKIDATHFIYIYSNPASQATIATYSYDTP